MYYLRSTLAVAQQTFLLLLRNRLLWLLLPAELACLAIGVVAGTFAPPREDGRALYVQLGYWLFCFVLAPWVSMFFAIQVVHGDIEDRTFQYLFLRPVRRSALLLGKWLAVAALCGAALALGVALLFVAITLPGSRWIGTPEWQLVPVFAGTTAAAAVAYTAIATWFAARFRRPLVWAAMFLVGLQHAIAFLPAQASLRVITVADPVRRILYRSLDLEPRLARDLWPTERDWRPELVGQPELNLLLIVVISLALGLWVYCRSEYDSRPRE
jgi:ABC-type transport system involved in multi-copper enzyme maturation permease subunit